MSSPSTIDNIITYGGYSLSLIFFLFWAFQLIRSGIYYYRSNKEEKWNIFSIHFILFIANILYLRYEFARVDHKSIPCVTSMYFLLDIASIWCFFLITKDTETETSKMSPNSNGLFKVLIIFLCIIYVSLWFMGTGVKCALDI